MDQPLRLSNAQIVQTSTHTDLYRPTHNLNELVKVPLETAEVSRALLDQTLVQTVSTNEYDPAKICPMMLVDVRIGTDIVKACAFPWFANGNVLQYLRNQPNVDVHALVRDLAEAVQHIHLKGRVFGNIHPNNVMVDSNGHAVLIDVEMHALARLYDGERVYVPGMWAYKPPEQLRPHTGTGVGPIAVTAAMDVYSFATTSYAIFSRTHLPSHPLRNLARICENGHDHLERPVGMKMDMWGILRQCLDLDPINRPTMAAVLGSVDWS